MFVGQTTDTASSEISAIAALANAASGNDPLVAIDAATAVLGLTYHSLGNYQSAVEAAVAAGTGSTSPVVDVTGSVTADLNASINNNQTSYSYLSLSADLTLNQGAPLTLSVTAVPAQGGIEYWSSLQTWDSGGVLALSYLYNAGFSVANLVAGVLDLDPLVAWQFASTVNTLEQSGPTNGGLALPSVGVADIFGVSVSVGASIQLSWGVTIANGADVLMDQANVEVNDLTIDSGGTLSAGSTGFLIDNFLYNSGSLEIVPGPGGTVAGDLLNSGRIALVGNLAVQGQISNWGWIDVLSDYSFSASYINNVGGTIAVALGKTAEFPVTLFGGLVLATGGTVSFYSGSMLGGTLVAENGDTVTVDPYGTLDAVVLVNGGSGSFLGTAGIAVVRMAACCRM